MIMSRAALRSTFCTALSTALSTAGAFALLASGASAADDPTNYAPATVTVGDNAISHAWVKSETLTSIVFVTGDDPNTAAQLEKRHGEYTVEYEPSQNPGFLRAERNFQAKAFDKAMPLFADALPTLKYDWEKETALIDGARCAEQLKKYDDGIADLDQFAKNFPQSVRIADALEERARLKGLKGDSDGAAAAWAELVGHEKDLGAGVAARGADGQAEALLAAGKPADAVTLLTPWFSGKVDPVTDAESYARLGLILAKAQAADPASKAAAIATYRAVAYTPVAGTVQARAHLEWAKLLATDAPGMLAAFDQAALALCAKDVDADVRSEARSFAQGLLPKLGSDLDAAAKTKLQFEYKTYLSKLP